MKRAQRDLMGGEHLPHDGGIAGAGCLLGWLHRTPSPQSNASVRELAAANSSMLTAVDGAGNGARKIAAALGKPLSDWVHAVYGNEA